MTQPQTTSEKRWALFKDGKQLSKAYSTKIAAQIEAIEAGVVYKSGRGAFTDVGYEVRHVEE